MREKEQIKLKYVATSFSSAQKQSEVHDQDKYEVYGASGLVGYLDTYGSDSEYIGIVKDGAGVGRTNIYKPYTSLLGTMAYIIPRNTKKTNLIFLKHAIDALDLGNAAGDKATIPHIYFSVYGNRYILNASKSMQDKIAAFLDAQCSQVDSLIANVQSQIEKLKAYKQSLITEVVTKGLDPSVPMKDSGVAWIGEIAETFQIMRLKNVAYILDQYRKPITADQRNQDAEVLYDYYGASGVIDKIDGYTIDDDVMLIGEDGANLRMRNLPLMYEVHGKAWVNNHAHILKQKEAVLFYYLFYVLEGLDINPYITGSAQPKLNQENLKVIAIPVPALDTQAEIVKYIITRHRQIDALIAIKQKKIDKLNEYKKSLIYEYVTGKKEV